MLNGLDLFSGIGGISLALREYVRPIAYCETDHYCQSVLLSQMQKRQLDWAPIWDDVRTLRREHIDVKVDIIYGGFPCQGISLAGVRKGLADERSGLFFEMFRLIKEIRPTFVFIENVPGIRTNGLGRVVSELAGIGYDCRWTVVSAAEVGACHLRKRWFLLAYYNGERVRVERSRGERGEAKIGDEFASDGSTKSLANSDIEGSQRRGVAGRLSETSGIGSSASVERRGCSPLADSESVGSDSRRSGFESERASANIDEQSYWSNWWSAEPDVGRVADGVSFRVDRLRGLGNSVVPFQAKVAFERLMGL